MNRKIFLIIAVLAFFMLSIPSIEGKEALAQENIAKLSKFEGQVELVREGNTIPLNPGMPILSGDGIKTLEGTAWVEFSDGSTLEIQPQSTITVEKGIKKRKVMGVWTEEYLARTVKVDRGEVFAKINPEGSLKTEFESLAADAVVKGTTLTFSVNDEGYTIIQSEEGVLDCFTQDGWVTFTLSSGESVGAYICPPPENVVLLVCYAGTLEISAGNSSVTLEAGEQVALYFDPVTGVFSMAVVVGEVDTTCSGETISVPEGLGTTCSPDGAPSEPSTPMVDPCYLVAAPPPPAARMAPLPPPGPPRPPRVSPFR